MLSLNQTFLHEFQFTQEQVNQFAVITGDNNPVHLDPAFAAQSVFKRPVMHGMLGACVFSKVFGTLFPGEGTIYLHQDLIFMRPMFVDTLYQANFLVLEITLEKNQVRIETILREKENNKICTKGEALLLVNPDKIR
jgi:acyl dehydratase